MRRKREGTGMVRVRVLGAVEIAIGNRRIGMNTEGFFALALYLTTRAGERIPREELLSLFWTKGTDAQQRHALRQMLYRLRQKGCTLDEEGDWVRLDEARVDSDLRTALSAEWPDQATAAQVDAAARFMPIFSRKVAPNFVAWLDEIRELLSSQHRKAAQRQISVARREGRWADLERWAQSVLRTDPLNEEATLARAESAAMSGSKTIAMEILDTYLMEVGEISDDLGRPALALRKRLAERRPDWSFRGPKEVALIGRTDLMSRLTGLVEAAWKGDGSAVVLVGAPGIGKTRLAMETRAYAGLKGMRTVVVRAEAGMMEQPLAVASELAAALFELEGAAGCDPDALALVRRVLEARERPTLDDAPLVRSISDHLTKALSALLDACQHERRILIVVDDMHNADPASISTIHSLMRQSQRRRVAWVGTTRSRGQTTEHSEELPLSSTVLRVSPLSHQASLELVERTAEAHSLALNDMQSQGVVQTSAGNPLFLRELSLARATRPSDTELPDSLQGVIAERLGRLTKGRLRALRLVALLGSEATPARLVRLTGGSSTELSRSIESLEDDGLLSATLAGSLQLHECWQVAVIQQLPPATQSTLANECAEILLAEPSADATARETWRTAELLRLAGQASRALALFVRSADRLYDSGLPAEAAEVIQRALPLADVSSTKSRMLVRLATAHLAAGQPERCLEVADELSATIIPANQEERENASRALALRAEAAAKLSLPHQDDLHRLVKHVRDARISVEARQALALTAARLSANSHYAAIEREVFEVAAELDQLAPASISGMLCLLIYHTEHGPATSLSRMQNRIANAESEGIHPAQRSTAQRLLAHSLRLSGDVEGALAAGNRAFGIARAMALPDDAALSAELMAFICLDHERIESAVQWVETASGIRSRPGYVQRNIAIRHAADRLLMQQGQFKSVADRLSARQEELKRDPIPLSRATELATLAYCHSQTGGHEQAKSLLNEVFEGAETMAGLSAGDYCMELACRTLRACGGEHEADVRATKHVLARNTALPRPLAPFFTELSRALALAGH